MTLVAVVLATALIISLYVGNTAIGSKHLRQSIHQHIHSVQSSSVFRSGTTSSVDTAGNNIAVGLNNNTGGNTDAQ